ncbi:cupin domain-containing protein [Variovorax sp. LjRoot84]|uniref:cupin domain-containing protein n=1 Tax=Variovorax sp. LjRoot84 TaxID=3342340 RepID=UPI003F518241
MLESITSTIMSLPTDWLSHLLEVIAVAGRVEIRCAYGSPWRIVYEPSPLGEIPYHVVLGGSAVLEDPAGGASTLLGAGDIVWLPHGSAHVLHDGSGKRPKRAREREGLNLTVSENTGAGERLDMLCGRFIIAPPHNLLMRDYLPPALVVSATRHDAAAPDETRAQLAHLVQLMRIESFGDRLGGHAMLNALSATLFTLTLRLASGASDAPAGLLALAGHPRLAPAVSAIFNEPERAWTLPDLARRCNMSRATFIRQFQDSLGRTAHDLLLDVRMSVAANALKKPLASTEAVAADVGYQSVAAFRRAFTQRIGMTPGQWRRSAAVDRQSV